MTGKRLLNLFVVIIVCIVQINTNSALLHTIKKMVDTFEPCCVFGWLSYTKNENAYCLNCTSCACDDYDRWQFRLLHRRGSDCDRSVGLSFVVECIQFHWELHSLSVYRTSFKNRGLQRKHDNT